MKTAKIIYWITTIIIVFTQGVGSALTLKDPHSIEMFKVFGYPEYFRIMLSIFKIIGSIILIVPYFKGRCKEWVYAGFGIDFIAAAVTIWSVNGLVPDVLFPVAFMGILVVSYITYHKISTKP